MALDISNITNYMAILPSGTYTDTYSWTHTRAAGAGLHVTGLVRSNTSGTLTVTGVTFGGTACVLHATTTADALDDVIAFVATLDPGVGPTGSQTVTVTLSASASRRFNGYSCDVTGTDGATGGAATEVTDAGATSISVSYTPQEAGELLVACGGCMDGSGSISPGSGWTQRATHETGTATTGLEILLETRSAADASPHTADVTFSAARVRRGISVSGWSAAPAGGMMMAA